MILQPPPNVTLNDAWMAGLILAVLVELETTIIILLVIKLRILTTPKTNNRQNDTQNCGSKSTNLPQEQREGN